MDEGFQEYSGGIIERIIYKIHPMYRLSPKGILEAYEEGKWISAIDSKNPIRNEFGNGIYEVYKKWIEENNWQGAIIGMIEMRKWARWCKKSIFSLSGLILTTLGVLRILPFPISTIIGLLITIVSLWLNYMEIKKPIFIKTREKKYS